ncbi:MAG: hypothetical protein ACXWT4_20655 [Methylobacter sp.]
MDGDFDDSLLAQWCELYVRFVIKDRQRLASVVNQCSREKLHRYFLSTPPDIATFLAATGKTDNDYLTAYGYLYFFDELFWKKPHPHLLNGFIEISLKGSRYILTRIAEHPIAKAIPEKKRFKRDDALGIKGLLKLHHHWQEVAFSTELEIRRSEVFNVFKVDQASVKIGLSPFACLDDMDWRFDQEDVRGVDDRIPFWCNGAKNEAELLERLISVLAAAYEQQVHILLFPELVMTETLQTELRDWLAQHNAFKPIILLVIAGTRHVIDSSEHNLYSNRCTVFNHIGDIEWEQEKRQPFLLTAEEASKIFDTQSPAFEPTQLSLRLVMRHTALGRIATPICLDFLCDESWKIMPADVFLVPAMSSGLSRFEDNCRAVGNAWGAAAFVCNAQPEKGLKAVYAYLPTKDALQPKEQAPFLFTVKVNIDMNYN